jgi:REP element-mobilizing transposase RayT
MARVFHGYEDWASYHISTRTVDQQFWLASPADKQVILQALDFYRRRGDFRLFGFVIMSNHVHFIVQPALDLRIGRIVDGFKTWTSRRNTAKTSSTLWERRYDDNAIKNAEEFNGVLKYIHLNPVVAGIASVPEDYAWSSVHNYLKDGKALIDIDDPW